jgi:acetyl-CoA carboxylase carboxyltransferase component
MAPLRVGSARRPGDRVHEPVRLDSRSRAARREGGAVTEERLRGEIARIQQGHVKYRDKLRAEGKLFVRDRLRLLLDPDTEFQEDWILARSEEPETPADGVVTGVGTVLGRPVCVMANDFTVKAGSWGEKTVQKIVRIQEKAVRLRIPLVYLVDAAGGRISEQIRIFPGRYHAGRIFYNEVQLSGVVPQVCILFGPSPAGSAYLPALTDLVIMVEGKASMYVGSPRMVEMAIGEKVDHEALGGARMHCEESGCGDVLVGSDEEAIASARRYLAYMPQSHRDRVPDVPPMAPEAGRSIDEIVPYDQRKYFDMHEVIRALVDAGSWLEVKALFAREIITGFARLGGRAVGIVANQPKVKGGVLFVDSSDKAARFLWLCNAYNVPIVYLADVSGFMVGSKVERAGIIRHGAKMIFATSQATVPKICVVVRKCYGAGLYAMCGQAFEPDAVLALPQAQIAIMGPEPAVNAVYYNRIMELEGEARAAFVRERREEYQKDIDVFRLASEMFVDAVVPPAELRSELIKRLAYADTKQHRFPPRRNGVYPV